MYAKAFCLIGFTGLPLHKQRGMGVSERRFRGSVSPSLLTLSLGLPCPGHREGTSGEDRSQSVEHALTLLAHSGKIAADAAEDRRAGPRTKGPGNFLLDFDHP